jgi:hypothetical protein
MMQCGKLGDKSGGIPDGGCLSAEAPGEKTMGGTSDLTLRLFVENEAEIGAFESGK